MYFYPFQRLVIDESLVLLKGRLCDCKTGYVQDLVIYTGTDIDIPANDPLGHSGSVVKTLMAPFLGKGHILYTDNYYTSPGLSEFLHHHKTGLVGTVRENRKGMPVFPSGMRRGETAFRKKGHHLAIKWCDRKQFALLSGIHTGIATPTGRLAH